jgi:hypothetical protein
MGLSKSNRARNTAAKIESVELNPSTFEARPLGPGWHSVIQAVEQASQLRTWLEGMQDQLQKTAIALRTDPSTVLSNFQKILSRPSYFYAPAESADWLVLLGPRPLRKIPLHVVMPAADLRTQILRLLKLFLLHGSRVHSQLENVNALLISFTADEIRFQRQHSHHLLRRSRQLQDRAKRVQSALQGLDKKGSSELKSHVPLYTRMFLLQLQRCQALVDTAEDTARALRKYHRLHRRVQTAITLPILPAPVLPPMVIPRRFRWSLKSRGMVHTLHQWLMHPVIDTREPSERAS